MVTRIVFMTTPPHSGSNNNRITPATIVGLIIGVLGFATAIITNNQQLRDIYNELTYEDTSGVSGEWTWLFREYRVKASHQATTAARFTLRPKQGRLTGSISTPEGMNRDWKIEGMHYKRTHPKTGSEDMFISLTYVSTRPERPQSMGSMLFKYDRDLKIYRGNLLGYDMDIKQIISFPCVLTKEPDHDAREKYTKLLMDSPAIVEEPRGTQ